MVINWTRRWGKQIICIAASLLMFIAAVYMDRVNDPLRQGYLERGSYGEDKKSCEFIVEGACEEPLSCVVEISPLKYSQKEAERELDHIFLQLPELIRGKNASLDQVRTDLELITFFETSGIRASWQSENPEIVDSYGRITASDIAEDGIEAVLSVVLTDGTFQKEGEIKLWVYPPFCSEQERVSNEIEKLIGEEELKNPTDRQVMLPQEYNGKRIRYRNSESSEYWVLPALGVMSAVLLYGREKAKKEEEKKRRKQLLYLDYADVVYQLMVYIGAGLTVRKAWECIVQNYTRRRDTHLTEIRPAYEEMVLTLNQMQYGEPEGKAIDGFGRRCGLQPYLKLSSLLEQNRKNGTKNLKQMLEQEMSSAWEEQKHTARRMGEEAGTKLLVPLFLMLVVVMVIIMVPALMAVQ